MGTSITIYDVAKKSGVSIATVSRVINNPSSVKEEKKLKVLEVMEELNFEPNQFGRGLVKQTSGIVGVYFPTGSGYVYDGSYNIEILKGIDDVVCQNGNAVLIIHEDMNTSKFKFMEYASQKKIDGLFISGIEQNTAAFEQIKKLIDDDFPVVYVGEKSYKKGANVYANFENYTYQAFCEMYKNGHRKVLLASFDFFRKRISKIVKKVEKDMPDLKIFIDYFTYDFYGSKAKENILNSLEKYVLEIGCTVAFYPFLEVVGMVLNCCSILNISVPNNLSIIAVESIRGDGANYYPEINCFHVPAKEIGIRSAEKLYDQIKNGKCEDTQSVIEVEYIERKSLNKIE